MNSQQTEIMNRSAPEGKWIIGIGIDIACKYRLYEPKSVKKEVRAALK